MTHSIDQGDKNMQDTQLKTTDTNVVEQESQPIKINPFTKLMVRFGTWLRVKAASIKNFIATLEYRISALFNRHNKKVEFVLKVFICIIPVIFTSFVGLKVYTANQYVGDYSIPFTFDNFQNKDLALYINEKRDSYKFGNQLNIGENKIPEIQSSPISFVWKPKEFPLGKSVTVSAEFQDKGDWDISVVCPNCDATDRYTWKPFYRGKLNEYNVIKTYEGVNIYIRKDMNPYDLLPDFDTQDENETDAKDSPAFEDASSVDEWVEKNVRPGTTVEILDKSYPLSKFATTDIDFIEGSVTTIDKTLRGSHSFFVYLKDSFDLEVIKRDLNWADGADVMSVILKDVDDNVIYQNAVDDDERIENGKDQDIIAHFTWDTLPYEGVYRLDFTGNNDWTIKKFTINTNKIVFTGNTLLLDQADLYTEVRDTKTIRTHVWHDTAVQTIVFKPEVGETKEVEHTTANLAVDLLTTLEPGNYTIETKGDQYVSGSHVALNKDQYFEPFSLDFSTIETVIPTLIFSKINHNSSGDFSSVSYTFDSRDFLKLDNLNEIIFQLQNSELDYSFEKRKRIQDSGYVLAEEFGDYSVFRSQGFSLKNLFARPENITEFMTKDATVYLDTNSPEIIDQLIISEAPEGFIMSNVPATSYNLALKGTHTFTVYAQNQLIIDIKKSDLNWNVGSDEVSLKLYDMKGKEICSDNIADDNDQTESTIKMSVSKRFICSDLNPGVYNFVINDVNFPKYGDYLIETIAFNTNKVVINNVNNYAPITLYTQSKLQNDIDLYFSRKDSTQTIFVNSQEALALTDQDINKTKKLSLSTGSSSISVPKGYVRVSGNYFSFDEKSWFSIYQYAITNNTNVSTDYRIIKDTFESAYINSVSVTVR